MPEASPSVSPRRTLSLDWAAVATALVAAGLAMTGLLPPIGW